MIELSPDQRRLLDRLCLEHDLDTPEVRAVVQQAQPMRFSPGAHLVTAGDLAPDIFFILKGITRLYLLRSDGRTFNKTFHREDEFTGAHAAACTGQPSLFFIEALEPTSTLVVPFKALDALADRLPAMQAFLRAVAERLFWAKEQREARFLLMTATERYERLLEETPWLPQRVAQHHIASWLGITEVSLSRIRARRAGR